MSEAQALLSKKKWAEAAIVLRSVLHANPGLLAAKLDLARALAYVGRREEALSMLVQAAARERGAQRELIIRRTQVLSRQFMLNTTFQTYQEGVNNMLAQKYRAARDRFERALLVEPHNVEILTRIGQCLIMEGDFDSAAERLRIAKRLNPYEPEVHLWLGRALHQRGELREALDELRQARQGLKSSELAPIWLAEAMSSAGQKAGAVQLLEDDVRLSPFHVQCLIALANLYYESSLRDMNRDVGTEPPLSRPAGENSSSLFQTSELLWNSRRKLQLALSRLDKYVSPTLPKFEGELGVDLRFQGVLKDEIQLLLQKVESRIEGRQLQES